MNAIAVVILAFSVLGAVDHVIGNRIGVGKEFARAFSLFGPMALSMLGMLVLAPAIGVWLSPAFDWFHRTLGMDPSIIPASLLANDMGGMLLSQSVCITQEVGNFNAFVISSMMGCVVSYTIPFALGIVKREQHKEFFFGTLCGIVTIPVGSFVAGLVCGLGPLPLLLDLFPLILLSVIVCLALVFAPKACIQCFSVFGLVMKVLGVIGLVCATFTFLTGVEIHPHFDTFENAALICANACVTLSGALPLMCLISKLLHRPLDRLGARLGIDGTSALALLGCLVTNASTFGVMEQMNKKGTVLNSAFAVSAAFVFGSHLAFTMAFDPDYVLPMTVGKLLSGVCAVVLACLLYREKEDATACAAPKV